MRKWTNEQENYLIKIHNGKSNQEITNLINDKFGTNYTIKAINSKKKILKLVSNYKYKSKYSLEIIEYIKKNHKGKSTIELSKEINKVFNMNTTADNIQNLKSRIKRNDGFIFEPARNDGCIKKGNVPKNKGKKWSEYMSKEAQEKSRRTTFKKGNIPPNHREIGEERISKDGYIEIKVQDGYLNNNWQLKHRYIYEQQYGPIPKGYKVIFLDGNKKNFNIDNLKLISSAEELIMNNKKLRYNKKELTETGYLIAKVINKQRKIINERL